MEWGGEAGMAGSVEAEKAVSTGKRARWLRLVSRHVEFVVGALAAP